MEYGDEYGDEYEDDSEFWEYICKEHRKYCVAVVKPDNYVLGVSIL